MFIALREAKCSRPRRSRAGHEVLSQRQTTSSSSRCSSLPQSAQVVGITHGTESAGRSVRIGATTRGITSPAFSMTTVSPFAEVLARDVLGVVQRRHRDRGSGEEHRLEDRVGRVRAGASDVHLDPQELGVRLLRRELEGGRPARKLRGGPEPLRSARSSTLMTTPSVSNSQARRPSAHSAQKAMTSSMPLQRR